MIPLLGVLRYTCDYLNKQFLTKKKYNYINLKHLPVLETIKNTEEYP